VLPAFGGCQLPRQVFDVDTGPAIDVRRVFVSEKCDAHRGDQITVPSGIAAFFRITTIPSRMYQPGPSACCTPALFVISHPRPIEAFRSTIAPSMRVSSPIPGLAGPCTG